MSTIDENPSQTPDLHPMANGNSLLLIICLLLILVTTLGVNYFFYQKEQERLRRRQLGKLLQQKIAQILDAIVILNKHSGPAAVRELLSDYSIELIGRLKTLNPQSDIMQQLQSQKEGGASEGSDSFQGANAIKRTQAVIRNTIKTLKTLQRRGKLTTLTFSEHRQQLLWLHCQVEADAQIEQARRFAASQKIALAMSSLNLAKTAVSKTASQDPRKQEKMNEINKLYDAINPFSQTEPEPVGAEKDQSASS